jgi:hypothetical protein
MSNTSMSQKRLSSFSHLYEKIACLFSQLDDPRAANSRYPLSDILKSAYAMFSLKYPSLLAFEKRSKAEGSNLEAIYEIEAICSDSQMRETLDRIDPKPLDKGFGIFYAQLAKLKVVKAYQYWKDYVIVSIDGVEHFHSQQVCCQRCLKKELSNGEVHYSHSMLAAVMVHPEKQEVFPLGIEPILQQDGQEKGDCERNAAKRLITALNQRFPALKKLVVEDALYANGPHIRQILSHGMSFIIGVKPKGSKALFTQFEGRRERNQTKQWTYTDDKGMTHHFEWANNLPLNGTASDLRVNMLQYAQTSPKGKTTRFAWVSDIKLTRTNVKKIMRAGRARWKIENETFNTLKNQGYHFEHNYGHGKEYLATILAVIMFLAFTLDQIQQHCSSLFKSVWRGLGTKVKLWEAMRAVFMMKACFSMENLFQVIAQNYEIQLE